METARLYKVTAHLVTTSLCITAGLRRVPGVVLSAQGVALAVVAWKLTEVVQKIFSKQLAYEEMIKFVFEAFLIPAASQIGVLITSIALGALPISFGYAILSGFCFFPILLALPVIKSFIQK